MTIYRFTRYFRQFLRATAVSFALLACVSTNRTQAVQFSDVFTPAAVPFNVGSFEIAVVHSTGLVYAAGSGYGNKMSVIDPTSNLPIASAQFPVSTANLNYSQVNQTTNIVYFRQRFLPDNGANIVPVDGRPASPTFNQPLPTLPFAGQVVNSFAINQTTNRLYATHNAIGSAVGQVSVVDINPASPTFHQVLATVPMLAGASARGIAVNATTNKIYVASSGGVFVINGTTNVMTLITSTLASTTLIVQENSNLIYGGTGTRLHAIDGITDALITTVTLPAGTLGGDHERMAVNSTTNRLYVTSAGGTGNMVVIDTFRTSPTFNTIVATVNSVFSGDIAVDESTNKIIVPEFGLKTTIINGATNTVAAVIESRGTASDVAINPATDRAFVASQVHVTQNINLATNTLVANIATAANTTGGILNPNNNLFYVGRTVEGTSVPFYNSTAAAGTVSGLPHANGRYYGIAQNTVTNRIYVVNNAADIANSTVFGHLTVINGATNTVVTNLEPCGQPIDLGVNETSNKIYVACFGSGGGPSGIGVINGANNAVSTVNISGLPGGTSFFSDLIANPSTNRIYTETTAGQAVVVNGATDVAAILPITGVITTGINNKAINRTLNRIYYLTSTGLRVLNGSNDAEIANIPLASVGGIAVNETTGRIYISNPGADTITAVDAATNTVIGTVPVGAEPTGVAVNTLNNRVYVGNLGSRTVSFVDGNSLTVTATLSVPLVPYDITPNPVNGSVFVSTNFRQDTTGVFVILDSSAAGLEADVAPRQTGDGVYLSTDIVQVRRFVAGLDTTVANPNEFQRADSAPRSTLGDGAMTSTDVVQARRYVAGLDPLTNAGGPTVATDPPLQAGIGGSLFGKKFGTAALLRLEEAKDGSMVVALESDLEVSAVSFGLRYDPALGRAFVLAGDLPDGAVLTVNDNVAGELTILIDSDRSLGKSLRLVSIGFENDAVDRSVEFDGVVSLSDGMGNAVAVAVVRGK